MIILTSWTRFRFKKSDGYIDRAVSDLKSYFLQGTYVGKTTLIKSVGFLRNRKPINWTIHSGFVKKNDRTSILRSYTDASGNNRFYDTETDTGQQDHFTVLEWKSINEELEAPLAFHYTKGKGYKENYKENGKFSDYGLTHSATAHQQNRSSVKNGG
jgi:iron complex outermembrane receptor protein